MGSRPSSNLLPPVRGLPWRPRRCRKVSSPHSPFSPSHKRKSRLFMRVSLRAMRYGLNFFPSFRLSDMSTAEYFDQVLRLAERADALGYTSAKAVEHYFHDYGGHTPSPIVLLAAIAVRTRRLRPITGAVIPAFNHPIKLAGELAMLDNISQGRLDVGFGRAFIPTEFEALGVPMDESRARFEEGLEVIRRLWT